MLEIVPVTFSEANEYVRRFHRHHKPVVGCKFCVACSDGINIVGVAIVGRPVARSLDNGRTLEVNRLCTNGAKNACSILYAAAWRAARALGYIKLITYILASESGSSLRASGWREVGSVKGRSWSCESRPRIDKIAAQSENKLRFEVCAEQNTMEGAKSAPNSRVTQGAEAHIAEAATS
jgi:hypothetical protein